MNTTLEGLLRVLALIMMVGAVLWIYAKRGGRNGK